MSFSGNLILLFAALASVGCHRGGTDPEVVPTTLPKLLGCANYQAPHPSVAKVRVAVDYVVDADGRVKEGSVVPRGGRRRTNDPNFHERARHDAYSCLYEPARRGNTPVEARVSQLFSYTAP